MALVENNRDREKRVQKLLDLLYGKDGVKKRSLSGFKGTELVTDKHVDTLLCKYGKHSIDTKQYPFHSYCYRAVMFLTF